MSGSPSFDPVRFLDAQRETYVSALDELGRGQKRSHWMWFIFPQLRGLGHSPMAQHFALSSPAAARAYLDHPVLGLRLRAVTEAVLSHPNHSLIEIFGHPDDLKFRSCMTLFARSAVGEAGDLFRQALAVFCDGTEDPLTIELLDG